ncbi:MAG: thiol-disulfide oxidoreductase [bacterium ADurb.BinA186]|nr:MAG: thiol-disulfide oxidoreductase [bacterium ADurb.BinA186]
MALLTSEQGLLGMQCPDFSLKSVDDQSFSRDDFKNAQALLITFICNHCPYVKAIEDRLIALARSYEQKSVQLVAICSNDAKTYPEDSKEQLFHRWMQKKYGFPYLVDEEQNVARAFKAVCTPEFYLFDQDRRLFYHGRLDDSWREAQNVKSQDLAQAIEKLISGQNPPEQQYPSQGCSIKWRE